MKGKRVILAVTLAILLGFFFVAPSMAWQDQKPEFVWKCQSGWPRSSGLHYLQMRTLDFIEAWTKGRVKFERYSDNEIVPGYEVWIKPWQKELFPQESRAPATP